MRISDWSSDVCSSDLLVMTLARPEDEDGNTIPGLTGLGLFLIPRTLDDGTPNAYRIVRLKNKRGTRSIASGEIRMEGALASSVGAIRRGFKQMIDQNNMYIQPMIVRNQTPQQSTAQQTKNDTQ